MEEKNKTEDVEKHHKTWLSKFMWKFLGMDIEREEEDSQFRKDMKPVFRFIKSKILRLIVVCTIILILVKLE